MGKKKADTGSAATPATKLVGLSPAIQEALDAIPEARNGRNEDGSQNREGTQKIRDFILTKYPHLKPNVESATFSSTLSNKRKQYEGESSTHAVAADENNPTFHDMEEALALCDDDELGIGDGPETARKLLKIIGRLEKFRSIGLVKNSLRCAMKLRGEEIEDEE